MGINATTGAVFGTPTVAGTFNFTVTAHDSGSPQQTASKILSISCASAQTVCALNCSADVPGAGVTNIPLGFVASSSSSTCTGTVSQLWTFGDGKTATGASVSHAYGAAGVFNWTLTISQGSATCVRNGSVTVGSAASGLPIIDYLHASRDQIAMGDTSELTWGVRNASTIMFEGLGNVPANSATTVSPASTTTYKLVATNSAGSQTATVIIRVDSILNVSIRADRITGAVPLDIMFTTLVSGGVPPYRYEWSFGGTAAQATHRWTTAAPEDVSCTVTDAHGTIQKSNLLRIVPSVKTAVITLGFSDLTPPNVGAVRLGASADGSTIVKVRAVTSSPGNVTFSFAGTAGSGRDGALFSFDGTGTGNGTARLTIPTTRDAGENVAAIYYRVPDDFANVGASVPDGRPVRTLTFAAQLVGTDGTSGSGSMDFQLRHAPVVFVHGIWSHGSTWDAFPLARDPDILYRNELVVADWDGISSIQSGASQVRPYLTGALQQMHMQGIAASSVDVVAHSMGGLIAKQIAHDAPGLVHKLITIDTPNFGSALADFVVANKKNIFISFFFLPDHPIDTGAADDLRVNVGASARRVNTGSLRAHSIVGVASDDEQCEVTERNPLPKLVTALCAGDVFGFHFATFADCRRDLLTWVLDNRPNDEIVDVNSQRGGFSRAVSEFSSGGATGQHRCLAAHTNMTSDMSGSVSPRVKALLDTNRGSSEFELYSLSAASLVGGTLSAEDEIASALSVGAVRPTASEVISIAAPIEGQVVTPGSVLEVTILAPPIFTNAFVVTPDEVASVSAQPLRARIDIPAAAIGQYAIGVRADTAAGESATASIVLNVVPSAVVTSLVVNPLEFFLNVGDTVKPFVRGVFADGVIRDLSRSSAVAFVSGNPSVVSALSGGSLIAVGAGSSRVTVSSGTASAEILINVESIPKKRAVRH
jgi:PKD repeat protein